MKEYHLIFFTVKDLDTFLNDNRGNKNFLMFGNTVMVKSYHYDSLISKHLPDIIKQVTS